MIQKRPFGPLDDDTAADEATAAMLRRALHREADAVAPSTDGWRAIQGKLATGKAPGRVASAALIEAGPDAPRRGPTGETEEIDLSGHLDVGARIGRFASSERKVRRWAPSLAAAAAVIAAATTAGILASAKLNPSPSNAAAARPGLAQPASTIQPGPTRPPRSLTPTHSDAPTSVPDSAPSSGGTPSATTPASLPVYFVQKQAGRWALVREFVTSNAVAGDPLSQLNEALRLAVLGAPSDPDYRSAWTGTGQSGPRAELAADGRITIHLTPALITAATEASDPPPVTETIQQLVWTATATVGRTEPVRIVADGAARQVFGDVPLEHEFTRHTGADDVRAPVFIASLVDGLRLHPQQLRVSGDAVILTPGGGTVAWTLVRADQSVAASGTAPLLGQDGSTPVVGLRGIWGIDLPELTVGEYTLNVMQQWPHQPVGATPKIWVDTKHLTVLDRNQDLSPVTPTPQTTAPYAAPATRTP